MTDCFWFQEDMDSDRCANCRRGPESIADHAGFSSVVHTLSRESFEALMAGEPDPTFKL
jgi:hypothetical protein